MNDHHDQGGPDVAELSELCTIDATMTFEPVGNVPAGTRIDVAFEGIATSPHWEGERPVKGVDYVTVRSDGNMSLDIRARIGSGKQVVAYKASGVSLAEGRGVAVPQELLTFETADPDLAFLNSAVGVAVGRGEGTSLRLTVYTVTP
jgi:hypothetical protein